MRSGLERKVLRMKDEVMVVKVKYSVFEEEHAYVLNLLDDNDVRENRYCFVDYDSHEKSRVVARVIGSVRTRHVISPEFVGEEEKLAVLWFDYVREIGLVRRCEYWRV